MKNGPKGLDKKTVDRLAREWDKKIPGEPFTIQTRKGVGGVRLELQEV
jgi:hypothetical protein